MHAAHEADSPAPTIPIKLQTGALPKYIFSSRPDPLLGTGFVQQTVQIVARFAITI